MATPEEKRLPMVGWYDPRQLAQTGVEVAISTIFGRHSDHRLVEAMGVTRDGEQFYDYTYDYEDNGKDICRPDKTKPRDSIWIDYVGDVGDGWNSTYAIAYHLAETGRTFTYTDKDTGTKHQAETKRGDLLIFGGDEVYPTASREMYEDRLLAPYETALRRTYGTHPHVFAIPGNHDWYDSLVAFTRLFTSRPWFAGWRTRQTRSYFALKLPHNWWLLGTDVQLGSDIDAPQMKYFESLTQEMDAEEKRSGEPASIILCHAEPHWIRAAQYGGYDPNYNESNLKLLEKRLGKNVAVFIAGDLHHYRRHEAEDKTTQKITAGGGGAFLHPTHYGIRGKNLDEIVEKGLLTDEQGKRMKPKDRLFKLKGCFPPTKESRKITWRDLIFPYLKGNMSRTFGLVTAVLYLLLTLTLVNRIDEFRNLTYQAGTISGTAILTVLNSPPTMFFALVTILGFIFFTDTHSFLYRLIMGGIHAITHILAAFLIALVSVVVVAKISALSPESWRIVVPWGGGFTFFLDLRIVLASVLIMIGGFIIGSLAMGIYLLLSLNFFGRHGNEAFSVLAVEDWKNFVRLNINQEGDLTIYPIGIRKVARKWKERKDGTGPELVPDDRRATQPELIEFPIVMKKAKKAYTGVHTSSSDLKIDGSTQTSISTGS
ncbi:MAG TPA: metallophosphoesterase [Pyrinomonadaceae bacterium]